MLTRSDSLHIGGKKESLAVFHQLDATSQIHTSPNPFFRSDFPLITCPCSSHTLLFDPSAAFHPWRLRGDVTSPPGAYLTIAESSLAEGTTEQTQPLTGVVLVPFSLHSTECTKAPSSRKDF